ncbi:hypothetical protein B4586_10400 [Lacticaseibacillus paracasei]|nr:hypothetical protein B4586_10400 [Lacticaseibacillus paracasei]
MIGRIGSSCLRYFKNPFGSAILFPPRKRVHQPRNLRIRTSSTLAKARPMHLRPLILRFLTELVHALYFIASSKAFSITCSSESPGLV